VDPVPDSLLLRKSGSAGIPTRDLCVCSQEVWPLDHRGGHFDLYNLQNSSSYIITLRPIQAVTEMTTTNLHGGKRRQAREADKLTDIHMPVIYKVW
jgi:hypothetical protein